MKNNLVKGGDLIFIPSDVTLLQFYNAGPDGERHHVPAKLTKTIKPSHAVLASDGANEYSRYYKVFYKGQYWFVERESTYECE